MAKQFDQIYQTHYDKVYRLCLGYVNGETALAKDLAQDSFIKVWQHLSDFKNKSNIGTWIYRITANTCLQHIRDDKKMKKSVHTISEASSTEIEDKIMHERRLQQMYACIHQLKKTERIIILLTLEGLAQKEIAEITGHSHENIRVIVYRIKEKLTKCVSHGI